ncbi:MAG: hypothetical protein FJ278_17405 [Planctomycetes bacterium]|nr:hypothetical protein [Planctomycetota bacterium]
MPRHLIIGNGVAGIRAAEAIRQRDSRSSVTILSAESYPFYLRPQLPRFVAGEVPEAGLKGKPKRYYADNGLDVRLGAQVVGLKDNKVTLQDGQTIEFDTLLIATGARPTVPAGVDVKTAGVVTLGSLDDAKRLKEAVNTAKTAVVLGAGIFGIELVNTLVRCGVAVTFLIPEARFWPEALDEIASDLAEKHLSAAGVRLVKGVKLAETRARQGKLSGVTTTGGDFIECQLLGVAEGATPNVDFLRPSGLQMDRGIVVDAQMRTNLPNVFAAGDCAQVAHVASGGLETSIRWQNAWQQGAVAGANMAGEPVKYPGVTTTASVLLCDVEVVAIGKSNAWGGDYKVKIGDETAEYPQEGIYKKLVADQHGTLVGALFLGNASEANDVDQLVRDKARLSDVSDELMKRLFGFQSYYWRPPAAFCPVCKLQMVLGPDAKEGDTLACPACGVELEVTKVGDRLSVSLAR